VIRALVIDDSAYNRVTISRMLQNSPQIEVVGTAVNGEDGIKQVLKHQPDVITLDLEMPGMDGFAFLRWLMQNRPTAVIAVSSRTSDRSVFKALELGAVEHGHELAPSVGSGRSASGRVGAASGTHNEGTRLALNPAARGATPRPGRDPRAGCGGRAARAEP